MRSSALIDGVSRPYWGSIRTVAAHFSIGLAGPHHKHSGVVWNSHEAASHRQDIVRPVDLVCTSPHPPRRSSAFKSLPSSPKIRAP